MRVDLEHRFVELWDLPVNERLKSLLQPVVIPLELPLVFLLVRTYQTLIFAEGIFTPNNEQAE